MQTPVTFLLQSRFETTYIREADTSTVILAVAIIAGFVILLIIAGVSSRNTGAGTGSGTGRKKKFSKRRFRRQAAQLGLSRAQIRTLEYIRDRYNVRNPGALLMNSAHLDTYLNRAVSDIEETTQDEQRKEAQKLTLFRIKQAIERNTQKARLLRNTRELKAGQPVSLSTTSEATYRTKVVGVLRDGLAVVVPTSAGSQVRWKKWTKVGVFFWKPNGEGYSFTSKVMGYNLFRGSPCVFLQHSAKIERAKQRKYRRKPLERPCYFYPVRVLTVQGGRHPTRKAFVETKRSMIGTVLEVSAGGCSVRATRVLPADSLIKLDFETARGMSVSAYGKVVNKREIPGASIMHIMFTRLSRKNMNRINTYIYEYGQTS